MQYHRADSTNQAQCGNTMKLSLDQHQSEQYNPVSLKPTVVLVESNLNNRNDTPNKKEARRSSVSLDPTSTQPTSVKPSLISNSARTKFNRFESAPQEGWRVIKKWVENSFQTSTKQHQAPIVSNIQRQLEANTLTPVILAMSFIKDENNHKRMPILLNLLSVKLSVVSEEEDAVPKNSSSIIHKMSKKNKKGGMIFRIEVQYGNISWFVYRKYWDIVKLHYQYKTKYNSSRDARGRHGLGARTKPPRFPSVNKRHFRKQNAASLLSAASVSRRGSLGSTVTSLSGADLSSQRTGSFLDEEAIMSMVNPAQTQAIGVESTSANVVQATTADSGIPVDLQPSVVEMVKVDSDFLTALENYLNRFISTIPPCGNINRMCKFLEISTLGLGLSTAYPDLTCHGKEGFAVFQSRTDRDPKQLHKFLEDGVVCSFPTTGGRRRRKPKWFIVRDSYIICVNDPTETEVYDVFLFDQSFDIHRLDKFYDKSNHSVKNANRRLSNALANASHWTSGKSTLCFKNMHGVYHFRTKNSRQAKQFEKSIKLMAEASLWCRVHRFDSFAPVRENSSATWFVDGRDYFWDVSVALENAQKSVYIHDWWLSPELFLRRPGAKNPEWRLDRILRRKADQGVKIYIVMYKEVAMALPLFSHRAKRYLLSLSPNIFIQRHPSRALDVINNISTFFWSHHEKICVVDDEIAFIGGLDHCFGRYDTPDHVLADDLNPSLDPNAPNPQIWPGKDFSNPRIIDFHTLDKPFEDNQDRKSLPRMPWHDISVRITGRAARDVSRHFIQRWNFLRRTKSTAPKRPTPMLLPLPENYLSAIGIDDPRICHPNMSDSCHVQILRSVSSWSIGSIDSTEQSIHTAYCESIKKSEHFIYIENQFFVTSTKFGSTIVENKIGEAIYERILRAYREGKNWRAIIIIPLVPGFPGAIDETEATSVRNIMEFQFLSISRGPNSIISRLHAAGVSNTHHYINIYGLRNWSELNNQFVTEQVYIHAKTMIVDDNTVIIGSANINERSQLGNRDSEIAAYIEDKTDMIDSYLDGEPVKVGRFAHTLRMRLMSEHIGLDVDQMDRDKYGNTTPKYFDEVIWSDYASGKSQENDRANYIPPFIQVAKDLTYKEREREKVIQEERNAGDIDELQKKSYLLSDDSADTSSSNESKVKHKKISNSRRKRNKMRIKSKIKDRIDIEHWHSGNSADSDTSKSDPKSPSSITTDSISGQNTNQAKHGETSRSSDLSQDSQTKPGSDQRKKSIKENQTDFWAQLDPDTDNNGDSKANGNPQDAIQNPLKNFEDYYNTVKLEQEKMKEKTVRDIYKTMMDPLTEDFQNFWHLLARYNTDLFRRAFLVFPDNNVRTWDQYHQFNKVAKVFFGRSDLKHGGTNTTAAVTNPIATSMNEKNEEHSVRNIIHQIRGHLVIWPNHFMEDDDGNSSFLFGVDKIAPSEIFD